MREIFKVGDPIMASVQCNLAGHGTVIGFQHYGRLVHCNFGGIELYIEEKFIKHYYQDR